VIYMILVSWLIENWKVFATIYLVQGVIGVLLFEWAWKKAERVRCGEKAMYDEFPSFKRLDLHLWSRSKFYPGCFFILIPRCVWGLSWLFFAGFCQVVLYAGKSYDVPLSGWRRTAHKYVCWTIAPILMLGFGYVVVPN